MGLSRYLVETTNTGHRRWLYEFPNGVTASVIPDLHQPFRFELTSTSTTGRWPA